MLYHNKNIIKQQLVDELTGTKIKKPDNNKSSLPPQTDKNNSDKKNLKRYIAATALPLKTPPSSSSVSNNIIRQSSLGNINEEVLPPLNNSKKKASHSSKGSKNHLDVAATVSPAISKNNNSNSNNNENNNNDAAMPGHKKSPSSSRPPHMVFTVPRPPPVWSSLAIERAYVYAYDIERQMWSRSSKWVRLDNTAFARGSLRLAHHLALYLDGDPNITAPAEFVAKVSIGIYTIHLFLPLLGTHIIIYLCVYVCV